MYTTMQVNCFRKVIIHPKKNTELRLLTMPEAQFNQLRIQQEATCPYYMIQLIARPV